MTGSLAGLCQRGEEGQGGEGGVRGGSSVRGGYQSATLGRVELAHLTTPRNRNREAILESQQETQVHTYTRCAVGADTPHTTRRRREGGEREVAKR